MTPDPTDLLKLLGLDLPPDRLEEALRAFAEIRAEIDKLHALDLADLHPAVVFRPIEAEERDG
jgi:hypothetical protein